MTPMASGIAIDSIRFLIFDDLTRAEWITSTQPFFDILLSTLQKTVTFLWILDDREHIFRVATPTFLQHFTLLACNRPLFRHFYTIFRRFRHVRRNGNWAIFAILLISLQKIVIFRWNFSSLYLTDLMHVKQHHQKKFRKNVKKVAKIFASWKICITFALAIRKIANASLAQLVEHDTLNVGVQGSSPWGGTETEKLSLFRFSFIINKLDATRCNSLTLKH